MTLATEPEARRSRVPPRSDYLLVVEETFQPALQIPCTGVGRNRIDLGSVIHVEPVREESVGSEQLVEAVECTVGLGGLLLRSAESDRDDKVDDVSIERVHSRTTDHAGLFADLLEQLARLQDCWTVEGDLGQEEQPASADCVYRVGVHADR